MVDAVSKLTGLAIVLTFAIGIPVAVGYALGSYLVTAVLAIVGPGCVVVGR